jgi:hypothetical protein
MAWQGRVRALSSGAQAAALLTLALPAILLLAPVVAFAGGVPFACSYVPGDSMRVMAPIYAAAFLIGALMFARLQFAILTGTFTVPGLARLFLLLVSLRFASSRRRRVAQVDFDEAPVTFQQLGLHS